jgi:hypothetical protein
MPETLFLTMNLIDRYLAIQPVEKKNLQLVGMTAMLVASKYEEIWAPEVCILKLLGYYILIRYLLNVLTYSDYILDQGLHRYL